MAASTLAPLAPAQPATDVVALFRSLETELNSVFFERRDAIETVLITLLAREHGFILGPPGTAKSELLEVICKAIIGAKYWRILLDKQMGKEESFGQIDQADFLKTGHWGRDITDTFADCHVALLDEVGNTGPAVLNPYLTAMNERYFKPNGSWIKIPLISAFGASNYLLEQDMIAMWDRFLVRFDVDYIVEDGNFNAYLEMISGQRPRAQVITQIPLPALQHAIDVEVPAVHIPTGIFDSLRQLRSDLRAEQVCPSDRRWGKVLRLLKAAAYKDGCTQVQDDHLAVLQHCLWDVPEQRPMVTQKVLALTSPMTKIAMSLAAQVDDIVAEIESRKGQSVQSRAAYGGTAQFELKTISEQLDAAEKDAIDAGRSTAKLESVRDLILATRIQVFIDCMNTPPERAAAMAAAAR